MICFICLQKILSKSRGEGYSDIPQILQDCMASTGLEWYIIFVQGMKRKIKHGNGTPVCHWTFGAFPNEVKVDVESNQLK